MAFRAAGNPEVSRQFLALSQQIRSKLEDTSPVGSLEGVPQKTAAPQPVGDPQATGANGEFGQAARNPKAGDYFGEWLARHRAFDRNMTGEDPNQKEMA